MRCLGNWNEIYFISLPSFFITLPRPISFLPSHIFHCFPGSISFLLQGVLAWDLFILLPSLSSFLCLGYFHSFAWDIFISLPGIFSFPCPAYFHSFAWNIFIPLPGIFSFPSPAYFHSFAWDIFTALPRIFSFLFWEYFHFFALSILISLPSLFSFLFVTLGSVVTGGKGWGKGQNEPRFPSWLVPLDALAGPPISWVPPLLLLPLCVVLHWMGPHPCAEGGALVGWTSVVRSRMGTLYSWAHVWYPLVDSTLSLVQTIKWYTAYLDCLACLFGSDH